MEMLLKCFIWLVCPLSPLNLEVFMGFHLGCINLLRKDRQFSGFVSKYSREILMTAIRISIGAIKDPDPNKPGNQIPVSSPVLTQA